MKSIDLVDKVIRRLRSLSRGEHPRTDGPDSFPIPPWWQRNFWEPTVALAIRDFCQPGNVVFDVGANAGALSMMMSRLVGPRGIVCAFEASPRIIDKTHFNLVNAGCSNVTLYHKAVWRTSGSVVQLAAGWHLNDRIEAGASGMPVTTVALDDFATAGNLNPAFVKMDIEGAELDALKGMGNLLHQVRPTLVLEQSPSDMSCHELLTAAGYAAVDLATYRCIRNQSDYAQKTDIANVLYMPEEKTAGERYFAGSIEKVCDLDSATFERDHAGNIKMLEPLPLRAGRYIVQADFSADGNDNEIFAGIEVNGETAVRYHTYTRFMANSYSRWVVQLDHDGTIRPFLCFIRGADPTLRWNGATVYRLPAFDQQPQKIIE